ncbi:MAG: MinD/ParA family protein [Candidatus Margulisiibacteriota bacterium]|jgi:MinD-like ATPase involved in chromosome partitioning or flagellar assembly
MAKIISIHSFRGGTGKSNFSANIATRLALTGKKVGIVDSDIQSPGIHVIFNLTEEKTKKTLNDFLKKGEPLENVIHDVTPENISGKIYLAPASMHAHDISIILRDGYDINMLCDGFKIFINKFELDYLLIDTHPGLNETTLFALSFSDILFLILRPDQQDFQGTAVTLEVANKLEVPKINLVMNKAFANLESNILKAKITELYHTPIAGILPFSEEMLELGSRGLFVLEYPDLPYAKEIKAISKNI